MPDLPISSAAALTGANLASLDLFPVLDTSAASGSKGSSLTPSELFAGLLRLGNTSLGTNVASGTVNLGSITDTTSRPLLIQQTWNNAGVTATAFCVNATNTASGAGSMVADFRVDNVSVGGFHKNGYVRVGAGVSPYYLLFLDTARSILTASGSTLVIGQAGISVDVNNSGLALSGRLSFQSSFSALHSNITAQIISGANSPESVVTANVGSLFLRTNGGAGTTLYVKESGTGNTGWVAK